MIITRAPLREPVQPVCSFGFNVKLRKVNVIINPTGIVKIEVQKVFGGKLLGKFGLVRNPLVQANKVHLIGHMVKGWSSLSILFQFIFCFSS